jgi:hypothetical protein
MGRPNLNEQIMYTARSEKRSQPSVGVFVINELVHLDAPPAINIPGLVALFPIELFLFLTRRK